ncbi:MAG: NHL repeat-containing protein [Bacteroidota bacterium]
MSLDTPLRANQRSQANAPCITKTARVFLGAEDNPLLAPRGVHLVDGKLIVADTGQNRVFIWNELPENTYQQPDVVLGQVEKTRTNRNAGGQVSARSLLYPSGLWSDGKRLIVCDAWNHRVLIWHTFPTQDGQAADVAVGQPSFEHNEPNVAGIGAPPTAQSLHWPYGVDSDGQRLFIADTGNRRVLVFDKIPTTNYAKADAVIGKKDFADRDYDHTQAIWPYSVKLGFQGELAITDTQYYRVLLLPSWQESIKNETPTQPCIIGQETLEGNGQNQFRWFPEAHTLNWCYDSCFYQGGLLVADTGNSRILHFKTLPTTNNHAADAILGQASFQVGIENRNSIHATPNSLYWPFHLSLEKNTLVAADTGNHRIVIYSLDK